MTAIPARTDFQAATALDGHQPRVALLRVDADLRAAVPPAELAIAERVVTAPCRTLGSGTWTPESLEADSDAFAALLFRGLVTHETTIGGRRSAELLGPGDVFHPWRPFDTAVPGTSRWASGTAARLAVLDTGFIAAARRWPGLFGVLHERLAEQLARATAHAAIMGLPRVEQRVIGLFWQLADRWGKVCPDGVVIDVTLTHELIGQLIGAQRPTVSLALQALAQDGLLQRTGRGGWLLAPQSRDVLPDVPPIGPLQTATVRAGTGDAPLAREPGAPPVPIADHRGSSPS
jgi:CRP/FNR family transcriptional regulator, cyclic AMP receptor protein